MPEIKVLEKVNAIQRVQLLKQTVNGRTTYRIMHRDLMHMTEENFEYVRIDFAVKKYIHEAGTVDIESELIKQVREAQAPQAPQEEPEEPNKAAELEKVAEYLDELEEAKKKAAETVAIFDRYTQEAAEAGAAALARMEEEGQEPEEPRPYPGIHYNSISGYNWLGQISVTKICDMLADTEPWNRGDLQEIVSSIVKAARLNAYQIPGPQEA